MSKEMRKYIDTFKERMLNENKDSATEYRGITIIIKSDGRYYTLGAFYRSLDDAKSKIDRYWDYDEDSDSVV